MHFLVALAEQADMSMKMYERLIFGEDEVGARSFMAGKSGVNESGAVREACYEAVQDRGCERVGKPVQFRGFLKIEHGIEEVPLAPFKGNRFNRTCLCTCSRTSDCWMVSPGCQTGAAYSCKGRTKSTVAPYQVGQLNIRALKNSDKVFACVCFGHHTVYLLVPLPIILDHYTKQFHGCHMGYDLRTPRSNVGEVGRVGR